MQDLQSSLTNSLSDKSNCCFCSPSLFLNPAPFVPNNSWLLNWGVSQPFGSSKCLLSLSVVAPFTAILSVSFNS